jgi:hypothetical protein
MTKRVVACAFVVLIVLSCGKAVCQEVEKTDWNGVISVNPLGLVIGAANVNYEHVLSPGSAIVVNGDFGKISSGDWSWTTLGGGLAFKKYTKQHAPRGVYLGGGANVLHISADYETYDISDIWNIERKKVSDSSVFFSVSGMVGYQWIISGAFAIDLAGGLSYYAGKLELLGSEIPLQGLGPYLGFSLGYAF